MSQDQNQIKQTSAILKAEVNVWINEKTGERVNATEIIKKIGRNGFVIAYLSTIVEMLECMGNKKMQVVKHILQNMDYNNVYLTTTREISKKTGISTDTITNTLKILEKHNIITRRVGSLMVNPKLLHAGSAKKEIALLTRFSEFDM